MSSISILREFVVKLGFKVDDTKYRRFQEVMHSTAKNAVEMSKTMVAASAATIAALTPIAQQMENLYFASRRTGASAGELKSFAFAASQIGVSAEKAQGALESLAAARRMNPGLNGILGGMGIDPKQTDNAKVMIQLLGKFGAMPHYQGAQIAGMFGIDEQTLLMLEQGLPQMQKYLAMREKIFSAAGINPRAMTAQSHEFMEHLRTFEAAFGNLADIVAFRLMPIGEKVVDWLTNVVMWFTRADKATGGWSSRVLGLAVALKGTLSAWGLASKLLGRGAAGAGAAAAGAGEAAAGEGVAAAAGGGLLAGVALPAIIIAAVGAALVWMMVHKDQVRGAASNAWEGAKKGAHEVHQAFKADPKGTIKTGIEALLHLAPGSIDTAAAKIKGVTAAAGPALIGMLKHFEGFRDKVYKDVGGKLTIGYGHLVRAGENFAGGLSKDGAMALLIKDMGSALASVHRLVKAKLNGNQEQALADFVFNLGEGKLAKSTLLKKLNAGDFAGAANQFQYWNHALVNGHLTAVKGLTDRRAAEAGLFRTPGGRNITVNAKTDIHVSGSDPHATGQDVERRQRRNNADLVRNFSVAVE